MKEVYVVELGGVSHEERGYLRMVINENDANLREGKWGSLKYATQFPTEKDAIDSFHDSGIFGSGVIYRTGEFNDNSFGDDNHKWLWQCCGTI